MKFVILKTGSTYPNIKDEFGDFEDMIKKGMRIDDEQIELVDVRGNDKLPDYKDCTGVIITGSHSMVTDEEKWIRDIEKWISESISEHIPILGICFGHQLIANAFGGKVWYHPKGIELGEINVNLTDEGKKDVILGELGEKFSSYAAHSQTVVKLPSCAKKLAYNSFDENHAFRIGDCIWSVQFHPEFTKEIVNSYIKKNNTSGVISKAEFETNESEKILLKFKDYCINEQGK
ncbi:glutamine amidotransferase [Clostridium sp. DL1XJH146]